MKVNFIYILFPLAICIGGCQLANFAGGGSAGHIPPKNIFCNKPWYVTISFSVWPIDPKQKLGKLSERWKDVIVHIRDSSNGIFYPIPMILQKVDIKTGSVSFKADMKPIGCDSDIKYVEYYIDEMFDDHYNRTELYRIPISKN